MLGMFRNKKPVLDEVSKEEFWDILSTDHNIRVGDYVQPISGRQQMRSWASPYDCAIVMSLNPFVMVSEETDMKWSCEKIEDYESFGQAPVGMFKDCWKKRMDGKPPKLRRK